MAKTLYISDLDGTLLTKEQKISEFTAFALNSLVEKGMFFSYATARSFYTAGKITENLSAKIPVIVYNGTFILENGSGKKLFSVGFEGDEAAHILRTLNDGGVYPFVYSTIDSKERFSYIEEKMTPDMRDFLSARFDERRRPTDEAGAFDGEIFHFSCLDTADKLIPMYEKLKDRFRCVYYIEEYSKKPWLEIHPREASKATAIKKLKELLGCDRVVCFGDGINDIPMFEVADECYAVANAADELKQIATAVIASNEEDGVAKWLLENAKY
ncbi:MAG: HAD family hydrolase [Ruminococcaceae bacterium]|nr:HAD family hydrolase [Oscillospiraceae bacterium]